MAQLRGCERARDRGQTGNLLCHLSFLLHGPLSNNSKDPLHPPKCRKPFYRRGNRGRERGRLHFPNEAICFGWDCFLLKRAPGLCEILHVARREPETEPRRPDCLNRVCSVTCQSSWMYNASVEGREESAAGVPAEIVNGRKYSPNP